MKKWLQLSVLLMLLACVACNNKPQTLLLFQNIHPGFEKVDVCVADIPKGSKGNCQKPTEKDSVLWQGTLPFNGNEKHYAAKILDFSQPKFKDAYPCCLEVQLSYKGEVFSQSSGSWGKGLEYNTIRIQSQGGAYYVNSFGSSDKPKDYKDMDIEPLDEATKKWLK